MSSSPPPSPGSSSRPKVTLLRHYSGPSTTLGGQLARGATGKGSYGDDLVPVPRSQGLMAWNWWKQARRNSRAWLRGGARYHGAGCGGTYGLLDNSTTCTAQRHCFLR